MAGIRAYFLEDLDKHVIPHLWNVNNLKRSLGPYTLVKLTLNDIFISVKQILGYVRSLKPHTWVKLTPSGIFISVK